jgi:hypothetical protein
MQHEITEETRMIMVVSLLSAQVLHETLDELEYTDYYRHSLKQATNRFQKELTAVCDPHIEVLYKDNEKAARQVQDGIERIARAIATMKPSEIAVFGELLEIGTIKYTENGVAKEIQVRDNSRFETAVAHQRASESVAD